MFGKSNRRTADGPAYDQRYFVTNDARCNAFDDLQVIATSQSGLYGLVPLFMMQSAQMPSGFDYMTNLIGIGGSPSPVATAQPLITQPQFAQIFVGEVTGTDTGLE